VARETDRRGFFREFLREAAGVVREANLALRTGVEGLGLEPDGVLEPESWYESAPVRAVPARGVLAPGELVELCGVVGLGERVDAVKRLLRPSLRLTHAIEETHALTRSRLGGIADLTPGFQWPSWRDEELAFIGQLDLAELSAFDLGGSLPERGLLLFFWDVTREPSGLEPGDRRSCRVVHLDADPGDLPPDPEARAWLTHYPLALSLELTLPRSSSQYVEALELDEDETPAWDELRECLARAQGVELEELTPHWQALHRLFGYPEELGLDLHVDCQLVSAGVNVLEGEGYEHPRRAELESTAGDWRLLLQVSGDEDLGSSWGDGFGRIYFWIDEPDLRSHNFDGVWAILR
jgi:uncharacterized protein YwqG